MNARYLDVIGVGECMVELYADQPLGRAPSLIRSYGGDVLNSLVAICRLGGKAGFITRVGNDPFGQSLLSDWQNEGIDTRQAHLVDGENGVYFISLTTDGEREFTYRRSNSAASLMEINQFDFSYIQSANCLLLSGITQALSDSAQRVVFSAAVVARQFGVKVAFDPNYRPQLWRERGGVEQARAAFKKIIPYVDYLLPSYPSDLVLLDDSPMKPDHAVERFGELCSVVGLKLGSDGCLLISDEHPTSIPATSVSNVVDSTGAGDAWNGAFLFHYLRHFNLLQAATEANRYAAMTLGFRGAIPPFQAMDNYDFAKSF